MDKGIDTSFVGIIWTTNGNTKEVPIIDRQPDSVIIERPPGRLGDVAMVQAYRREYNQPQDLISKPAIFWYTRDSEINSTLQSSNTILKENDGFDEYYDTTEYFHEASS